VDIFRRWINLSIRSNEQEGKIELRRWINLNVRTTEKNEVSIVETSIGQTWFTDCQIG
jgi:hypothetical protein